MIDVFFQHPSTKTKTFKKQHMQFCDKYRLYQEEHGIANLKLDDAIKKLRERPYEHYKEDTVEGMEQVKNEKLARKQKIRKYIKKIKIQHLNGDEDLGMNAIADTKDNTRISNIEAGEKAANTSKVINENNPFKSS